MSLATNGDSKEVQIAVEQSEWVAEVTEQLLWLA